MLGIHGEILRSEENNTSNCIVASNLTVEGSYTCEIYDKLNDETLCSKPIVLTVETALDKHAKTLIVRSLKCQRILGLQ